jgi:hypothetical protein
MSAVADLLKTVELGLDAQAFLASSIGKAIAERVEVEVAEAVEDLKAVNPEETQTIRRLQTQIHRAEQVIYWLVEFIDAGHNAEVQIQSLEATD